MATPGAYSETMGRLWIGGNSDTCSKCGGSIGEDEVPLILFKSEGRDGMYVYCEGCEPAMLPLLFPKLKG